MWRDDNSRGKKMEEDAQSKEWTTNETICNKATISQTKCHIRKKKDSLRSTWHCKCTHVNTHDTLLCAVHNKIIHIECVKRSIDISSKNKIANESVFCLSFCFDMVYAFFSFTLWYSYTYHKKKRTFYTLTNYVVEAFHISSQFCNKSIHRTYKLFRCITTWPR